jgi:hypothetical protein
MSINRDLADGKVIADNIVTSAKIVDATIQPGDLALLTSGVGVGQTWQNMTASRALDVTYTNSTGKPIMVIVRGSSSNTVDSYSSLYLTVGSTVCAAQTVTSRGSVLSNHVSAIVPNNTTYSCAGAVANLEVWSELR